MGGCGLGLVVLDEINAISSFNYVELKVKDEVWSFDYFFGRVGGGWVGVLDDIKAISSFNKVEVEVED